MKKLKDNSKISKILIYAIIVNIIMAISSNSFNTLYQYYTQDKIILPLSDGTFLDENIDFILSSVFIVTLVVFFVSLVIWTQRAYINLSKVDTNLDQDTYWASLGWFIPIINLYTPYQIIRELFGTTNKVLVIHLEDYESYDDKWTYKIWWGLCILSIFLNKCDKLARNKIELDSTDGDVVLLLCYIGFLALTYVVVKEYSKMEKILYDNQDLILNGVPANNLENDNEF